MKSINHSMIFIRGTFVLLMIFFQLSIMAQGIQEKTFDARWLVFSDLRYFANTQAMMVFEGDTMINLSFNKSDSTFHHMGERWHYRMNTQLQVVDSFQVWNRQSNFRSTDPFKELSHSVNLIQDGFTGTYKHYECLIPNDSSMQINLYDTQADLRRGLLLLNTSISGVREVVPYVFDTTLTLFISEGTTEPLLAQSFSLNNGNLINEDTGINVQNGINIIIHNYLPNVSKIIPNSQNAEEVFFFANGPSANLLKLNWKHLKFQRYYVDGLQNDPILWNIHRVSSWDYFDVYFEDTTSFRYIGRQKRFSIPSSTNHSFNIAVHEYNNQDTIFNVRDYGNPNAPDSNDVIGLVYRKYGNTEYILGRKRDDRWGFYMPFRNLPLILYTIDSSGVDSLYIHGYANHMPLDMQRAANGDLYILSALSANQTNHQVFTSITKIPASILVDIKEQKISRKLYLYPNPTQDVLRSDEFLQADEIRVFSLSGRLEKSFRGARESIPLNDLNPGTYIIQVQKASKISSGIVIKH